MLLDRRDIELLRLAGYYRWLPYEGISNYGFGSLAKEIDLLAQLDLLRIANNRRYLYLSPQGYRMLQSMGYSYEPNAKRAYNNSPALRRRLEVVDCALTCRRAGIDVLGEDMSSLQQQPSFCPAFSLRTHLNLMNAASCVGIGHWGNTIYMLQYVGQYSPGMYPDNELKLIHNLASAISGKLLTPIALIFAGQSYKQMYQQLHRAAPSKRHGKQGFLDYGDVYRHTELPLHLLSCDETGALQLALMCQPEHKTKIAQAAFGERWQPHDEQLVEADGCVDGNPLIIAADMDIRRVDRLCLEASRLGRQEVLVAALGKQMTELLLEILQGYKNVTPLSIEPVLPVAFGEAFGLWNMELTPYMDAKGGVIHV